MVLRPIILAMAALASLSACSNADEGALDIALIGDEESILTSSVRLSGSAQHLRAATQSGLVTLNGQGDAVPALAETWIVVDDGRSVFFRLRDGTWPDGEALTADSAQAALSDAIEAVDGTSLGKDLEPVEEVRAMAGRVIELRLSSPLPDLLQLLAQPEMALRQPGGETGPMMLLRTADALGLDFKPPLERGLPDDEDWREDVREVRLHIADAGDAIAFFDSGEAEVVLGGRLGSFPMVDPGPLSTGTLRIDTTFGLFGLQVRAQEGLLSNSGVREGLAMALDREALLAPFNVAGWVVTTRPVSPDLPRDTGLVRERWEDEDIAALREEAAARISAWRGQFDGGDTSQPATILIAMPDGQGWDRLFNGIAQQWAQIGIRLVRTDDAREAGLVLVDRVARYPSVRWFLNQFNCELERGLCSEDVDALVAEAIAVEDLAQRTRMLAQAEAELTLENVYIPIASPLRWSLVRGGVNGFSPNVYAFHPLPDMALIPR